MVVYDYGEMLFADGVSRRVIRYDDTASKKPSFAANIPHDAKVEACSVENCVYAIATTSPLLAWLGEGEYLLPAS